MTEQCTPCVSSRRVLISCTAATRCLFINVQGWRCDPFLLPSGLECGRKLHVHRGPGAHSLDITYSAVSGNHGNSELHVYGNSTACMHHFSQALLCSACSPCPCTSPMHGPPKLLARVSSTFTCGDAQQQQQQQQHHAGGNLQLLTSQAEKTLSVRSALVGSACGRACSREGYG